MSKKGKEFSTDVLLEINDAFAKDSSAQNDLRRFFSQEPSYLRQIKENDEFKDAGIVQKDGTLFDVETEQPLELNKREAILNVVAERMLTESNPLMRELGYEYSGSKIIRRME